MSQEISSLPIDHSHAAPGADADPSGAGNPQALVSESRAGHRIVGPSLLLGIAGGIACGKSTVGELLKAQGVEVIDADNLAHELQAAPCPTYDAVVALFGSDILACPGGKIDGAKLGRIVFADKAKLTALNQIMQPAVVELMKTRVAALSCKEVAVLHPILFELDLGGYFDEVWVIDTELDKQTERLMKRNHFTGDEANQRISAQMSRGDRRAKATVVIDNSNALVTTEAQVLAALANARASKRSSK